MTFEISPELRKEIEGDKRWPLVKCVGKSAVLLIEESGRKTHFDGQYGQSFCEGWIIGRYEGPIERAIDAMSNEGGTH